MLSYLKATVKSYVLFPGLDELTVLPQSRY